jgi:predicted DNA-binding protein (UPF0251 family)
VELGAGVQADKAMKFSTCGRPRILTEKQIEEIRAWHRSKLTNAQMAARYGIARTTLERILHGMGGYKQATPVGS